MNCNVELFNWYHKTVFTIRTEVGKRFRENEEEALGVCKQCGRGGRDIGCNNCATSWKRQTWCSSDSAGQRMWSGRAWRCLAEQLGKCKNHFVSGTEESRAFRKGQGDPFRYVEDPMSMALEKTSQLR